MIDERPDWMVHRDAIITWRYIALLWLIGQPVSVVLSAMTNPQPLLVSIACWQGDLIAGGWL